MIGILFHGARQSLVWFVALLTAIVGLAVCDPLLAPLAHPIALWAQRAFFVMNFGVVTAIVYIAIRYYAALLDAEKAVQVRLNERLLAYLGSVAAVTSAATAVEAGRFDPASLDEVGRRPTRSAISRACSSAWGSRSRRANGGCASRLSA